jgi:signal transduction histidine kinase
VADQIYNHFNNVIPENPESLENFIGENVKFNEFRKYVGSFDNLYNISIYNFYSNELFTFSKTEETKTENESLLYETIRSRLPASVIWVVDSKTGKSKIIESIGVFDGRFKYSEFYFPIVRNDRLLGVLKVSLFLDTASKLVTFFFIGNASLAFIFIITAFIAIYLWSENAINRPIRILLDAQEKLRRGDFTAHVDLNVTHNNELSVIANSFNKMTGELYKYQEELKEQKEKLEEVNEQYRVLNETLEQEVEKKTLELKEFFSLITHDLKIPLAAIKGYTSLLKKDKTGILNEKQAKFVSSIDTAAVHLLNMVKNMLDSVKYDDGRVTYFMEDFNLLEVALEVEDQIHPIIHEKNIEFKVNIPEILQVVNGDKAKIGQVVTNIVSNAINYSPNGGIIEMTAQDKDGLVEVGISDMGIGIPEEQISRIFEKFRRVPNIEAPSTSLGLGLYIVRKIIEGHGMKVRAESEEGKGSSFYFTLKKCESIIESQKGKAVRIETLE